MPDMEQAVTFQDPAGHAVSGILASPPHGSDRLAVLCHGFLSNKNSHTNLALTERLLSQSIATFRFDFFGQGESEGPFERITVSLAVSQALAALDLMYTKNYRKLALVGSSFGGLVALLAAAKLSSHPTSTPTRPEPAETGSSPVAPGVVSPAHPKPVGTGFCPEGRAPSRSLSCLALKCPVPSFPEMLNSEFGKDGMARWKESDTIPNVVPGGSGRIKLSYAFYEDSLRYCGYDAAKDVTVPTFIVQGAQDEYVSPRQILRLSESLGGPNCVAWVPDADHQFSKPEDFQTMTTLLSNWVADHLSAPSAFGLE